MESKQVEWPQFYKDGREEFEFAVCHKDRPWRDHKNLGRQLRHTNVYSAVQGKNGIRNLFDQKGNFKQIVKRDGEANFVVIWSDSESWALISDGVEIVLVPSRVVDDVERNREQADSIIGDGFVSAISRKTLDEFEKNNFVSGAVSYFAYHKTDEYGPFQKGHFYSGQSRKPNSKFYVISRESGNYFFEGIFEVTEVIVGEENPFGKKYDFRLHDISNLEEPLPLAGLLSNEYLHKKVSGGLPFRSVPINDQILLEQQMTKLRQEPSSDDEYLNRLNENEDLDRRVEVRQRGEQQYVRKKIFGTRKYHRCIICDDDFPVELLVAAHIRKRSMCDSAMKLDFHNNVFPMCRLGCDELFERGFVAVNSSGMIDKLWTKPLTGRVETLVDELQGKSCSHYEGKAKDYFDWHFDYHRQ